MSPDELTVTLGAAFAEERAHYERALSIATQLPVAIRGGEPPEPHLQAMMEQLQQIVQIEARIAEPKQRWLQANAALTGSPELEAHRTGLIALIQQLQEQLQRTARAAGLRQSSLLLELDGLLQGQRMRRAYGAVVSRRHGPDGA